MRPSENERIETTVCDHDAEDRATLERYGVPTVAAYKAVATGIEAVQSRLRMAGDKRPRLFLLKDSLVERDESLVAAHKPTCTEEEIPVYSYPKGADGKPLKEEPVKMDDHGCDAMRYGVAYADSISKTDWWDQPGAFAPSAPVTPPATGAN